MVASAPAAGSAMKRAVNHTRQQLLVSFAAFSVFKNRLFAFAINFAIGRLLLLFFFLFLASAPGRPLPA
jgi:hypothetical protein